MLSRTDDHFGSGIFRYLAKTRETAARNTFEIRDFNDTGFLAGRGGERGRAKSKIFESADGSVAPAIVRVAYRRFPAIKSGVSSGILLSTWVYRRSRPTAFKGPPTAPLN